MTVNVVLALLLGIGAAWTVIWYLVIRNVRYVEDEERVNASTKTLRRRVTLPFIAIMVAGVALSLYWMPYPENRARLLGDPEVTIDVQAVMWAWIVSEDTVPVDTSVEFAVTSLDVNHNFAIYSPDGDLLTQVQAMPGYTNRLIFKFDKPGQYTIRCLEYCGTSHHFMLRTFTVV